MILPSKGRYKQMIYRWLKRATHNILVHPILTFLPRNLARKLHNTHAYWVWGETNKDIWEDLEDLKRRYGGSKSNGTNMIGKEVR